MQLPSEVHFHISLGIRLCFLIRANMQTVCNIACSVILLSIGRQLQCENKRKSDGKQWTVTHITTMRLRAGARGTRLRISRQNAITCLFLLLNILFGLHVAMLNLCCKAVPLFPSQGVLFLFRTRGSLGRD